MFKDCINDYHEVAQRLIAYSNVDEIRKNGKWSWHYQKFSAIKVSAISGQFHQKVMKHFLTQVFHTLFKDKLDVTFDFRISNFENDKFPNNALPNHFIQFVSE